MKAVQFELNLARYAYTKAAGVINPKEYYGPRSCLSLRDVPEPQLRGPRWVKLRSVLSGFCGSDLGLILLHDSPTTIPFTSFPFTLGHENCSVVEEVGSDVKGIKAGDRVTVIPSPGCEVREIDPPCGPCSRGDTSICENFAEGSLSAGMNIGFCRDTGGGWSGYYIAHESQVVKPPKSFTDEQVMMIEPLSCSLHPVMRATPSDGDRVLVIGCGVIGLGIIASIRALGIDCHITACEPVALNARKAREKGADEVVNPAKESLYQRTVQVTGAKLYRPMLEKPVCMGGYDRVFDCVGSTETIGDSVRLAAGGGTVVLIGIQMPKAIDWAPVWMKGLNIIGDLCYGMESFDGKRMHTFRVAVALVKKGLDVSDLITHRFSIDEYTQAIEVNMKKAGHEAIKTVFDLSKA